MQDSNIYTSIRKKIFLSFTAIVTLVVALSSFAYYNTLTLAEQTQKLYDHPFTVTNSTKTINMHFISIHRYMKDVVLADDEEDMLKALKEIDISETIIHEEFDIIFKQFLGDMRMVQKVHDAFVDWKIIRDEVFSLVKEGKRKEAAFITKNKGAAHVKHLESQMQDLIRFAHNKANSFLNDTRRTKTISLYTITLAALCIVIIISLVMYFLLKGLIRLQRKEASNQKTMILQSRMAQMGELLSMIAHQWKQPISAIAAVTMGLKVKLDLGQYNPIQYEELMEYTNNVEHYIDDLTVTLDDFRNFYKPNKKAALLPITHPISKALNILRPTLLSDQIEVIEEYETHTALHLFDNEFIQVILNLLKNAQDSFNDKGIQERKIKISTKSGTATMTIEICDNAGGIPDTIIEKIFDPYFSTKNEKNGTGLGLYMAKIIIEKHHKGKIHVRNKDKGTCFTIELDPQKTAELIS